MAPVFEESIEVLRERVARNLGVVVASKNLSPPHAAFHRQVEDDARQATQSSWYSSLFDGPLEKRRLRILQGLFYGLSRLDCSATVSRGEKLIRFTLVSANRTCPSRSSAQRLGRELPKVRTLSASSLASLGVPAPKPSVFRGWILKNNCMRCSSAQSRLRSSWQERCNTANWIDEEAFRRREEMKKKAIRKQIEQEKAERERLIRLEAARLKRLTDSAENYHRAETIRAFVASVISVSKESADPEHIGRWKEWALLQADQLDPIATGRIWDDVKDSVKTTLGSEVRPMRTRSLGTPPMALSETSSTSDK